MQFSSTFVALGDPFSLAMSMAHGLNSKVVHLTAGQT